VRPPHEAVDERSRGSEGEIVALTKCKECGGQVSTKAAACPHCGYPFVPTSVQDKRNAQKFVGLGCAFVLIGFMVLFLIAANWK
jgi:predicted amidophosphoribosyltransferase